MSKFEKRPSQHTYLLRCWLEGNVTKENTTWRYALECIVDGEQRRVGFTSLSELFAFLDKELHASAAPE